MLLPFEKAEVEIVNAMGVPLCDPQTILAVQTRKEIEMAAVVAARSKHPLPKS